MPDWTLYRHSGIHACPLSRYMLHDQSLAVCTCPCCMSMSILYSMSISMLHVSMLHVHVNVHVHIYRNTGMPECQTFQHPVSPVLDWKKLMIPEQVWYWTKLIQSSILLVWYRIKIWAARMPMPALVFSMPMPRYEQPLNTNISANLKQNSENSSVCEFGDYMGSIRGKTRGRKSFATVPLTRENWFLLQQTIYFKESRSWRFLHVFFSYFE